MTRMLPATGLAILLLAAAACHDDPPTPPAVQLLMECIECTSGELAAVQALGDTAVPALRRFLLDGPPAEAVDRMRRNLVALGSDPASPSAPGRLTPAVTKQLDDYARLYRMRATLGLGAIATARSQAALCAGRAAGLGRGGLGTVLDSALVTAGGRPCP